MVCARWDDGRVRTFLDGRVLVAWRPVATPEPLVRELVAELTAIDPGPLHHSCPFCGSIEHGRPYVAAPVEVSVAHAPGLTVVAASVAGRVGVDVELSADDGWLTREAIGKACGVGIASDVVEPVTIVRELFDVSGHRAAVVVLSEPAGRAAPGREARRRTGR